ncbi:hypothetical protein IFR05_007180 [Cadophora sp. M221]|nr:hypothetical protein IFR05_007180 [Cadophora sp. M221]
MDYVGKYYTEDYAVDHGNWDGMHTIDFYRLKSLDMHPQEKIRLHDFLFLSPEQQALVDSDYFTPPADESSLINASANLSRNLERLYKYTKGHHLKQANSFNQEAM